MSTKLIISLVLALLLAGGGSIYFMAPEKEQKIKVEEIEHIEAFNF